MSCDSNCGPLVIELLTGVPGLQGAKGDQGPQGPPGSLTSVSGDLSLSAGGSGSVATVTGIQSKPIAATTPSTDQFLAYNGTQWVPSTFSAGYY
jgi:hypothetical protein